MEVFNVPIYKINNGISIINPNNRNKLAEGLNMYNNTLQWVDILDNKLYKYELNYDKLTAYNVCDYPSVFLPTTNPALGLYSDIYGIKTINYNTGEVININNDNINFKQNTNIQNINIQNNYDNIITRYNDGRCDRHGRLWIGTMDYKGISPIGKLYNLKHKNLIPHLHNVTISNGLDWYNNILYYIDTPTHLISIYDLRMKCINTINLDHIMGDPDGMVIVNDTAFIAMWDGSQVITVDLKMNCVVGKIDIPTSRPTSIAIDSNSIYVSTAYMEKELYSGYILKMDSRITGHNVIHPYSFN